MSLLVQGRKILLASINLAVSINLAGVMLPSGGCVVAASIEHDRSENQ